MAFPVTASYPAVAYFGCDLMVFDGDSLTSLNVGAIIPYPARIQAAYPRRGRYVNIATGGENLAQILAGIGEATSLPNPGRGRKWYFVMGGANDINDGTEPTMISNMTSILTAARAAGFTVVALTMMKQTGYSAGDLTYWNGFRDFLINTPSLYDYLGRPDTVPALADPANTTYFYDGTHLTQLGVDALAAHVTSVVGWV